MGRWEHCWLHVQVALWSGLAVSTAQQPSTRHRVTSINHRQPGVSSAIWRPSSWTTSTDLHLLALRWWATVGTPLGQPRMLNAPCGKGMLPEQCRAPTQIISSPNRALVFPPPLEEAQGNESTSTDINLSA